MASTLEKRGVALIEQLNELRRVGYDQDLIETAMRWIQESLRTPAEEIARCGAEKFDAIFEHSPIGMAIVGIEGRLLSVNPAGCRILGYAQEELQEKTFYDITHPDDLDCVSQLYTEFVAGQDDNYELEKRYVRKDGSTIWGVLNVTLLRDRDGKPIYTFAQLRDITQQKLAEESVRGSQRELSIRNDIANLFLTVDDDSIYGEVLDFVLQAMQSEYGVFGYIDENGALVAPSMTKHIWDECQVEDRDIVFSHDAWGGIWGRALLEKKTQCSNEKLNVPEGHLPVERALSVPIARKDKTIGLLTVANKQDDYTDEDIRLLETIADQISPILSARLQRKKREAERAEMEERLRESEENARLISQNVPVAVYSALPDELSTTTFVTGQIETLTGYPEAAFLDDPELWTKIVYPEDASRVWNELQAHRRNKSILDVEYRIVTADNSIKWLRDKANPTVDESGNILRIDGFMEDITQRKLAEEALKTEKERAQTYLDIAPSIILALDYRGNITLINKEGAAILECTQAEVIGRNWFEAFVPQDAVERMKAVFQRLMSDDLEPVEYVVERILTRDGGEKTIRWHNTVLRDSEGEIIGALSSGQDMTELVAAEAALRESEEKTRSVLESSPLAIAVADLDGKVTECNQAALDLFRISSKDEAVGVGMLECIAPEDQEGAIESLKRTLREGSTKNAQFNMIAPDGHRFLAEISAGVVRDSDKNPKYIVANIEDITERKQAEERFRMAAGITTDLIYEWNIEDDTLQWFGELDEALGYDRGEIPGTIEAWVNLIHPEDLEKLKDSVELHRTSHEPIYEEYRVRHKSGEWRYWKDRGVPVLDTAGKPTRWIGSCVDVTEQKRFEQRLQFLSTLVEQSTEGVAATDLEGNLLYVNPAWAKMHGYEPEEKLEGKPLSVFHTEEQFEREVEPFTKRLLEQGSQAGEIGHVRKSGNIFPTFMSCSILRDADGEPVGLVAAVRDISGYKQTQEALAEFEGAYSSLIETMQEGVARTDLEENLVFVNQAFADLLGYTKDELEGMNLRELCDDEDFQRFQTQTKRRIAREASRYENKLFTKTGELKYFMVSGSPVLDNAGNVVGTLGIMNDVTEQKNAQLALEESMQKLQRSVKGTIDAMARTAEMRDPYTAGHQKRVAHLSVAIAREMDLPQARVDAIRMAAMIHDIGKINIPAEILSKPGELSALEVDLIRVHPRMGYEILKGIEFPWPIADIILQHHERLDGTGYPDGVKGDDIMLEARIIGVADVVEAMSSHRPYRSAFGKNKALDEIRSKKGVFYDPDVVDACVRVMNRGDEELDW